MTENNDSNKDLGKDEDCGCGCECHENEDVMYLTLEDNTELECNVLGLFEIDEDEYIALVPVDDDQVLLYRYEEDDQGFDLITIEDDLEFDTVAQAFEELFTEEDFKMHD